MSTNNNNNNNDWRIKLFGNEILLNNSTNNIKADDATESQSEDDDESKMMMGIDDVVLGSPSAEMMQDIDLEQQQPASTTTTTTFFDEQRYQYIAIFFGANYCGFCKKFAPSVVKAKQAFEGKNCKLIFVSNDRDLDNFYGSCNKVSGLGVMSYDLSKTQTMRDMFGLKTIPALMILKNGDFEKPQPHVISNAREILEQDMECENFPWATPESKLSGPITTFERLWIHGRHGDWWQLGHKNVSELHPDQMYMDEHAVRIRAGLLNILTWLAIINCIFEKDVDMAYGIFVIVAWEFLSSMIFGLTPFSPLGWIGTLMSCVFHPQPLWKPASPKRFAWGIGLTLATSCFAIIQFCPCSGGEGLSPEICTPLLLGIATMCNIATWLEGNAGFCIGCWMYNSLFVKYFGKEECKECKL